MKNHNPAGDKLHFATFGQRLFALFVFAVFGYLIWLAWTGRFDAEVNRLAGWLREQHDALLR